MTGANKLPCEHCQRALHENKSLEYLYCGHTNVVAFRLTGGHIDYVAVNSMEEAIAVIQETGQVAVPVSMPA